MPTLGDVRYLSTVELKLLVLARSGGDRTAVPFEVSELRVAAESACVDFLDVESLRFIVTRAGLSSKDCNTRELLRQRCRLAMAKMREKEIPLQGVKNPRKELSVEFPVTWRRFEVVYKEPGALGLSLTLVKGGLLEIVSASGAAAIRSGVKKGDILVAMNGCGFGDIFDVAAFEQDVLTRLKRAPRPLTLAFQVGDGRWPPTSRLEKEKESSPKEKKQLVDVTFSERGSLGFSMSRTSSGRLEVLRVRDTLTRSPCFFANVQAGDEVVGFNGRAFGKVESDLFDAVVDQLKRAPRPMTLTFERKKTKKPPRCDDDEDNIGGVRASANEEASSHEKDKEETKRDFLYKYDAIFPRALLGIALALSRHVETGKFHVTVTEVRPSCVPKDVEAHDRLFAINGEALTGVENEDDFTLKVLERLKNLPRPLTLTFTSAGDSKDICFSQAYAADLFADIDANQDGLISQVELIKALRKDPELARALQLPQFIRQEDGTRDQFTHVFHNLAKNDDKSITKRDWCLGISKLAAETII